MRSSPSCLGTALPLLVAISSFGGCAIAAPAPNPLMPSTAHDALPTGGPHDFDFEFGAWKAHLARLVHPLSGSKTWVTYDGTSVVRQVWGGKANLGELELKGDAGAIEGLTLRLYDPDAHRWSVTFASSGDGALTTPLLGGFHDGRGEFYDRETFKGRPIRVRFLFSDMTPASFRLEQAFSDDDGKTWEPNWVSTFERTSAVAAATSEGSALSPDAIRAILAAPDRTDADRKLDASRHAPELLAFYGVAPGMHVADLGAGLGYTTELLARAVGPGGKVYSQDDPALYRQFLTKAWTARLARPVNAVVAHEARPFDAPLPPEATNLDVVVNYIFYHDAAWLGTDRAKMNDAIFAALKPGGAYVIVDASAKDGRGVADARSFHRIEETVVENEVKKAGFALAAKAEFLRNPSDTRDWDSSTGERVGTEDRFVLKFTKPGGALNGAAGSCHRTFESRSP
jgi:predicted methyltransferase